MSHARQDIRKEIVRLLALLPSTRDRVFEGRVDPLPARHEPSLRIYTGPETIQRDAMGRPSKIMRTVTYHIVVDVSASQELIEDALDQICVDVETAMAADETLGGLAKDSMQTGSSPVLDGTGHAVAGQRRLDYAVQYRTAANAPSTIIA